MQRLILSLFSFFILAVTQAVFAERVPLYSKDEINIQTLIRTLKEKSIELDSLSKARDQLTQRELQVKQLDLDLHREMVELNTDQEKVRNVQMQKDSFQTKWEQSHRAQKLSENVKSFQIELKNYNAQRELYHQLASKLARYLQPRKPEDVRELIKAMILLMLDLETAVANGDYKLASIIAGKSTLAVEFGFPSKN